MKSAPIPCGNVKMKGKKTKLLYCGCCVAQDFRFTELLKQANKEINSFKQGEKYE